MFKKINNITLLSNEPLSRHTTIKIGGNAKCFICAHNVDALLDSVYTCNQHSFKYKIIGNGSNLLFDSLGFSGAVIKYDDNFMQIKDNKLNASSGCNLGELISYSTQHNLGGLEFAIGVPAQLGGAIVNNLGAYNSDISKYIEYVTVLHNKQILYLNKNECNFAYHSSGLQNNNHIVLGATFNLPFQDKCITQENALKVFTKRKNSQPLDLPNMGSIFRRIDYDLNNTSLLHKYISIDPTTNVKYISPALLIDNCGLKGLTVGGAQVSPKHAGFIVNLGNATSKNILKLIEIIKNKIYEKYNIILNTEIEYIKFK